MTNEQQTAAPRRVRPRPRTVRVADVETPTPKSVRVTFTGPELAGFTTHGPAEHIKVMFPPEGESALKLPEWGPEGPILSEGQRMPASRTYTPRIWRPDRLELVVDFMLHGEGLASDWARTARAGAELAVSGQPGGAYAIEQAADWFLIAGDESALPAIATILEALPDGVPARALIEVEDAAEEQDLIRRAGIELTWLHRHGASMTPGEALEREIRDLEWLAGEGRVWIGCEASIMRSIRRHLIDERGLDRTKMHTHGYWKQGVANHPDHDVGQDV